MDGKIELRTALGPDYKTALRALPGAVANLQHKIALGERRAAEAGKPSKVVGRYPLSFDQIALRNYNDRLAQDDALRNAGPQWASISINDLVVAQLRRGIAGQLNDADLAELVENRIARFRQIGNTTAEFGSNEWRELARAICISEYEALSRVAERDEGDYTGKPAHPLISETAPVTDELTPVPLKGLLVDYLEARKAVGKGREAERRWTPVFADLAKFLRHDDARRLTKQNLLEWRDARLKTLSAKTVADVLPLVAPSGCSQGLNSRGDGAACYPRSPQVCGKTPGSIPSVCLLQPSTTLPIGWLSALSGVLDQLGYQVTEPLIRPIADVSHIFRHDPRRGH
ncbi:hypothetical protein [Mesorhizobium sp. LjNodule214]|uniref:hypothetical protein n=1 Tax=Mesorhizobium sp. LjNodule214 TaxID=3342252 RepID=UPI003ECC2E30